MKAIPFVAILVVALIVGNMDYNDEVMQQRYYCSMVKAGAWPAYDDSIHCDDEEGRGEP